MLDNNYIVDRIEDISRLYTEKLQPLIILIEVNEQTYPIGVLNEVRSYVDHICKCFKKDFTDEQKEKNIKNAYEHIIRAIIDCYKILIYYNLNLLENLKEEFPTVDFHDVDNGEFYTKYYEIEYNIKEKFRIAKRVEIEGKEEIDTIMKLYENTFNESENIKTFIDENRSKIEWTRLKYKKQKVRNVIAWLISIIVTCILTNNNQQILQWFIDILEYIKNTLAK